MWECGRSGAVGEIRNPNPHPAKSISLQDAEFLLQLDPPIECAQIFENQDAPAFVKTPIYLRSAKHILEVALRNARVYYEYSFTQGFSG